ncbi:hypothetical protein GCM10023210_19240 [Chryseobacterium ginsengisoli]|uniref:Glycosyltransferase RgtA/B/C/D-like domain-containing protein n=1 Tax=Chryseobacterium ginsengisoli TaxID=363853 RepID=A0ABP9M6N0_9FLAO
MKTVQNIILFLSVLLLIGLVYISFFNVYQTDDYIFSYSTEKLGLIKNIQDFYMKWGGRYFGYTINMFNPVSYDPDNIVPKIYPLFLLSSFITVVTLNFKRYFNYSLSESFKKSLLLFFFYSIALVSLPEHYYWFTGSNVYFLPVILSVILSLFYGKYLENKNKLWLVLSILLIMILMGSNELLALLLLGILVFLYSQNSSKENMILLIIGTAGLLVSFLAPGNFNRMAESTDVFYIKWLKKIAFFGFNAVYIFVKVIFLIPLFIAVFEKELNCIKEKTTFKKAFIVWIISFLPLLLLAYILNVIGRQFENIIFFYLVTLSVVFMYKYRNIRKFWWVSIIVIFLPETDLFRKDYSNYNIDYNMNNFVKEIFISDLGEYDQEIENRVSLLKNSKKDSICIDKIKNVPKILYFDELSSVHEEKKYVNDQLEKYFHKKYIRIK